MLGIPKDTVHDLPEVHYPGRVILIDSAAKARSAVAYLKKQPQLGFDTETRPSFRKNHRYKVSLVQLSTPTECFLFRLKQIGSLTGLMSIFENPAIQKIGLSIKDDFHSLAKLCEFNPEGFVELQTFVKDYQIADNSLQKIFALIFGKRISKNQRLTNWEAETLTPSQQSYAAIDAWACVEIYNYLCAGRFDPEQSPYTIDDETARMLQSSVGIHIPELSDHTDDTSVPSQAEETKPEPAGTPAKKPGNAKAEKSEVAPKKSTRRSPRAKVATSSKPKASSAKSKTAASKSKTATKPKTATTAKRKPASEAKSKTARASSTKTKSKTKPNPA